MSAILYLIVSGHTTSSSQSNSITQHPAWKGSIPKTISSTSILCTSIVLWKIFASIFIKASDFKVQDSLPQIGESLEISNTLWRLKCIPNYGSEFSLEIISCTFAIFAFFPPSGAFLWEKLLYLQNVVTRFSSIAASHNFWWSPSHRWGKHKSSLLATLVTTVCSISLSWPTVFVQTGWVYFSQSNFNISDRNAMLVLVFCWSLLCWWGNHKALCPSQR